MEARKLDATLVERISKKGNTYQAIDIKLTDTYTKTVYLEIAEQELVKNIKPTLHSFGK